jgi:hypothetical protein
MHIASIWHQSGQDHLSPCCTGRTQQSARSQEVFTCATAGLYSESAFLADRPGSLRGSALHGCCTLRTRSRSAAHPRTVPKALPESLAEAVTKQNMRFVQIKTQEQLYVQAMHRVRDRLVQRRTALINEILGSLLERGITFPAQPLHLRKTGPRWWKMPSKT